MQVDDHQSCQPAAGLIGQVMQRIYFVDPQATLVQLNVNQPVDIPQQEVTSPCATALCIVWPCMAVYRLLQLACRILGTKLPADVVIIILVIIIVG